MLIVILGGALVVMAWLGLAMVGLRLFHGIWLPPVRQAWREVQRAREFRRRLG